jgi:hypothetical protein
MTKESKGHSPVGASGAYRWLKCPGSVRMSEGVEDVESKYAREGTAAHNLAYQCLSSGLSPLSFINGGTVKVPNPDGTEEDYPVSADMAESVIVYIKEVRRIALELGVEVVPGMLEQPFHLGWVDEELWGTNDFMVGVPFDTLHVYDYKHGAGVVVDAEDNEQLLYYALGALGEDNPNQYSDVCLNIVQPRACRDGEPIRSWKVSVEEVYRWGREVLAPGVAATRDPNAPLAEGGHCRFCRAHSFCPMAISSMASLAGLSAKDVFAKSEVKLPSVNIMTKEQCIRAYKVIPLFENWVKSIKENLMERALAGEDFGMEGGEGLKLVEGRSSRSWKDAEQAEKAVVALIGKKAYTQPALKSPAQVEAELKLIATDAPKKIEGLTETSRSKALVPESDKRAPWNPLTAKEVFGGVEK